MPKTPAFMPDLSADALGDAWKSLSGLNLPAQTLQQLQREYVEGATALWNQTLQGLAPNGAAARAQAAGPALCRARNGRRTRQRPTPRRCTC